MPADPRLACPYCDADLNPGALSCRACGRDLTPVLPLLRRLDALEARCAALEAEASARPARPEASVAESGIGAEAEPAPAAGPRRWLALPAGFAALIAAYWAVVIWLDLPLSVLRLVSMAIPFATGLVYLRSRPRLAWFDVGVAAAFALGAVAAMNALLGWIDSMPVAPQDVAAWRESLFYAFSIGASLFTGMLLRVLQFAMTRRGLTSLPRLGEMVQSVNRNVPADTIKAVELTILTVSAVVSAGAGLMAAILGLGR